MKSKTSILTDRFENIIKRNVLGEYTNDRKRRKNNKLNQVKYKDFHSNDFGFELGDENTKLKIFD